jgi:VCBS repeat-containing protein
VHSVSAVTPSAGALGTLTAGVSTDTTGSGLGGVVTWNYSVAASAVEYLAKDETKVETFTFDVDDGEGGIVSRTVSVTITGTNDAPVAVADSATATEDGSITFDVRTNDTDADYAATLTVTKINGTTISVGGSVVITGGSIMLGADGKLTYTPAANFNGTPSFTYTVSDEHGATSSATVNLIVAAVNDAPVNTLPGTFATNEDTAVKLAGVSVADDSGAGTITVTLSVSSGTMTGASAGGVTVSGSGTASLVLTGTLANINTFLATVASQPTYTPTANFNGAVTLTMVTNDGGNTGGGALTDTDTSTINIAPVNDAGTDLTFTYTGSPGNSLPNGAFGQITTSDPDGGGASTFSIANMTATTLAGGAASGFAGDLTISASGVISASGLDDNRIYEVTVRVTQDGNVFDEVFSVITGTNASDTVSGAAAAGDDIIFAQGAGDLIFAGSGNDYLFGQQGGDQLDGGSGTDVLDGAGGDDTLIGGTGNDTMTGGGNNDIFVLDNSAVTNPGAANIDTITDYAAGEIIDITQILSVSTGTNVISGGYLRVTTTGLVQVDLNGGGDNWVTLSNINAGGNVTVRYLLNSVATDLSVARVAPPIALDLNGDDVISFFAAEAGATFDYGAGKVATAWVAPQDGILVRDANHDGAVSASEIVFATDGSDLEGLAVYDSNGDGQLSVADAGFGEFSVWQDTDSDGNVDAGELRSLTAEGIASISLTSDKAPYSAAGGDVTVVGTGSYTRSDGSTGVLADAVFATRERASTGLDKLNASSAVNLNVVVATAAAGVLMTSAAAAAEVDDPILSTTASHGGLDQSIGDQIVPTDDRLHMSFNQFVLEEITEASDRDVTSDHRAIESADLQHAMQWSSESSRDSYRSANASEPVDNEQGPEFLISAMLSEMPGLHLLDALVPNIQNSPTAAADDLPEATLHDVAQLFADAIGDPMIDSLINAFLRPDDTDQHHVTEVSGETSTLMAILDSNVGNVQDSSAAAIFNYAAHDVSAEMAAALAT